MVKYDTMKSEVDLLGIFLPDDQVELLFEGPAWPD